VLITVFLTGAFFAGAGTGFLTIVALLLSLLSLIVLALPRPAVGAEVAGAALRPLPAPAAAGAGFSAVTFLVAPARVDFAFSTMFVNIPAAPPVGTGADGLSGETGRARKDFAGEAGRIGERGRVREFAERGERTCEGWILARDVVRAGGMGGPRTLFLGFSMSSFSLSMDTSSLIRFGARCGDGLARELLCSAWSRFLRGELIFSIREVVAAGLDCSLYFVYRSPIFALRNAIGIRLTLISIRVLSPCACRLYCARSFLARSVSSSCKLSIKACFCAIVIPIFCFLIGLLFVGVLAGLRVFVGIICGGAGKFWISKELVDSVDLRFLERVGAIFEDCELSSRNVVCLSSVKQVLCDFKMC